MAHSKKFSPSASSRWIGCPGSSNLCLKVPKKPESPYAMEGTVAHALAEKCLVYGKSPDSFIGNDIDIDLGNNKIKTYTVTKETAEAVNVYIDKVDSLVSRDTIQGYEVKFNLSFIHSELFGTSDCFVYNKKTKVLHVIDYKHGMGVEVFPENNTQGQIYAIGAIHELYKQFDQKKDPLALIDKVVITIVQPRIFSGNKIKEWETTVGDLRQWSFYILRPAIKACEQKDAKLNVGSWCKFCPAMAICPAQAEKALEVAKTDFKNPILPEPKDLTPEEIAKVIEVSDIIASWAKEVSAFAHNRLEKGQSIPGYKLVRKITNRKWIDEQEAEIKLIEVVGEEAYSKKLLSIAQAEKVLKKEGFDPKAYLAGLWVKPEDSTVVAPESDKRPAIVPAIAEFIEDEEFLK